MEPLLSTHHTDAPILGLYPWAGQPVSLPVRPPFLGPTTAWILQRRSDRLPCLLTSTSGPQPGSPKAGSGNWGVDTSGALPAGGSGRVEFGSRKGMEPDRGSDPAPDPGNCSAVSCELLPDTGNRSLRGWERHLLLGETEPRLGTARRCQPRRCHYQLCSRSVSSLTSVK